MIITFYWLIVIILTILIIIGVYQHSNVLIIVCVTLLIFNVAMHVYGNQNIKKILNVAVIGNPKLYSNELRNKALSSNETKIISQYCDTKFYTFSYNSFYCYKKLFNKFDKLGSNNFNSKYSDLYNQLQKSDNISNKYLISILSIIATLIFLVGFFASLFFFQNFNLAFVSLLFCICIGILRFYVI
ncbi:hypothetical protein fh0823_24090 [Francisella halioticida]|uniref:hypothetical protein n=1 Tax=Francisella halioticida TaxID=549298 RepID=UPI001AFA5B83|nr:hypothetical protein [Francisella halioticida]BCD92270.1 hypothetical protein fh0823_24090 [Francisella halioticida]